MIAEDYINFDAATNTCPPALNSDKIDWRITSIQDCISEYLGGLEKGVFQRMETLSIAYKKQSIIKDFVIFLFHVNYQCLQSLVLSRKSLLSS